MRPTGEDIPLQELSRTVVGFDVREDQLEFRDGVDECAHRKCEVCQWFACFLVGLAGPMLSLDSNTYVRSG